MAFSGPIVPNMIIVRFVMDNFWSVGRLETYITGYQPGGIPLAILRRTLATISCRRPCMPATFRAWQPSCSGLGTRSL